MQKRLANRLNEVLLSGTWIANTNFKDQITKVTWQEATKQIENLNTIALLTFHINYYLQGILEVLNGGELTIKDKYSFDIPKIDSEETWQNLVKTFITNAEAFVNCVEKMDESKLKLPFVKQEYGSLQRNIEGVIEHSYYHLGQVSLIRKMLV